MTHDRAWRNYSNIRNWVLKLMWTIPSIPISSRVINKLFGKEIYHTRVALRQAYKLGLLNRNISGTYLLNRYGFQYIIRNRIYE